MFSFTRCLLILPFLMFSQNSQAQSKIIAHRGFSAVAPENTLAAFQAAIDVGADYLELDVHVSKDGKPVVIHDATLTKTSSSGHEGVIAEMTFRDLLSQVVGYPAKFDRLYADQTVPPLVQVLDLAKDKIKVCVEVKVEGAEDAIYEAIQQAEMEYQVIIFSFYPSVLERFHEINPNIPTLFLIAKKNKHTIEFAKSLHANAIGVGPLTNVNKAYLKSVHEAGLELWRWTVNNPKKMNTLFKLPIDGLITNHPDKALALRP